MAKYHQRTIGQCLVALALVLFSPDIVHAQAKYSYITSTTSTTSAPPTAAAQLVPQSGYYKPVQVIKAKEETQPNKTATAESAESAPVKVEALPTPARLVSDYKAYGLPAYNGPSEHSLWSAPRRGHGLVDYTANSAGFVVSDLRPDASSNRGYDLASSSARIHQYNSRPASYRYNEKRSRSDYNPQGDSAAQGSSQSHSTDDLSGYLKTAASETSHSEQSAQSGASYSMPPRSSSVRRKPTYGDKSQQYEESQSSSYSYDPSLSKHFMKTHFRDHDYSGSSLMEAGEHMSASNDNELAQLAATMSELQSSPTSSTPEMFSPADLSQLSGQLSGQLDPNAYASLGSLSAASQMPAATAVPGVPAGAIVGAPGSQPPPGMKLAGYVTMAGPQPGMMSQMSAMNPMMRSPIMGSPSMRYPGMMPPPMMPFGPGPMGPNPMNPSLQQLIGSTFGTRPQQAAASNQNAQGSQASASSTSSTRSRFLSRLNPMNLFRRLRQRATPKDDLKSLETMLTSESRRRPAFASFVRRMGDGPAENDTLAQANSPFGLYRRSYGLSSLGYPSSPVRRGRRLHTPAAPTFYEAESRSPVSLMGSGNFEVIRGGYFPAANGDGQASASTSADRNTNGASSNNSEGGLDPDDQNIFDDIFSSGNPILGFQGFDHFGSTSVYNNLAPSNQQKVTVKPDAEPTPAPKS